MIPTSIDGTDITGATIDGTDVTEITVDGQTVFSATTLPVAYSNLVAWFPFDSGEYGGSNADDVTAIIGASGDDTAYDGTVSGATYQSSGGVTDINAGANSGGFDFDGSNDGITTGYDQPKDAFTYTGWVNPDATSGNSAILNSHDGVSEYWAEIGIQNGQARFFVDVDGSAVVLTGGTVSAGNWHHIAGVRESDGDITLYVDGSSVATGSHSSETIIHTNNERIGAQAGGATTTENFDGMIDDVRIYDNSLSSSEVSLIYQNSDP